MLFQTFDLLFFVYLILAKNVKLFWKLCWSIITFFVSLFCQKYKYCIYWTNFFIYRYIWYLFLLKYQLRNMIIQIACLYYTSFFFQLLKNAIYYIICIHLLFYIYQLLIKIIKLLLFIWHFLVEFLFNFSSLFSSNFELLFVRSYLNFYLFLFSI